MDPTIFIELSKILVVTVIVTAIIRALKQPALIGYIISGIICGPYVLNFINSTDTLSTFSQIGVALLLFFVGLNLNPKVIKDVGKISLITGLGQVFFTTGVGFLIAKIIGFSTVSALYLSVALAFSSTIVIMKLLSDKNALESLYGRISVGFLIVQDFVAILILLVISSLSNGANLTSMAIKTVLMGIGGMGILFLITIYVLPKLTQIIAKSQEFLLLFSLSWCFAIASLFHYINFSIEAGALLAGLTLSMSPYHFEISSKLKPLRDFFLILFFIMLGAQMTFTNMLANLGSIIGLSFFVLIGNPLIVMALMGFFGYTLRNSFMAGLTVAQVSEFSLIVISMGLSVGHVTQELLSILTAIALITFAGSTYMIIYSEKIYPFVAKYFFFFEKKGKKVDEHNYQENDEHDIILFGYNRTGFDIVESLKKKMKKLLIIDYDPQVIKNLSMEGYDCRYGDANNSEFLNEINFVKANMIISTVPNIETNLLLINKIKELNKNALITVVANQINDAIKLYKSGATYVIMPHFLGGKHFSTMLESYESNPGKFLEEKLSHIDYIIKKKKQDMNLLDNNL
ncbi:MAG: cation:proton antiporter [Candidatus Nanoarchaeia archaeon]|nr:cation:proton antiporter [Candidatus Nanoarchaeia archaeon]